MGRSALFKLIETTRKISLAFSDRTESFTHFLCLLKGLKFPEGGEHFPDSSVDLGKAINHQTLREHNKNFVLVYLFLINCLYQTFV